MVKTYPKPLRLKKMVELMLAEDPVVNGVSARNSDITLTIAIWQRWYSVGTNEDSTIRLTRLYDLPTQENVKRWRAKFQNEMRLYLPTSWAVAKARGWDNRNEWEHALGYKPTAEEVRRATTSNAELDSRLKANIEKPDKKPSNVRTVPCARIVCPNTVDVVVEFGKKLDTPFCSYDCRKLGINR